MRRCGGSGEARLARGPSTKVECGEGDILRAPRMLELSRSEVYGMALCFLQLTGGILD